MLSLRRISTQPEIFTPVTFHEGVNIIMGEKWDETAKRGKKTNGVGKSLFIEFIHFALLREFKKTRLSLIPEDELPEDLVVTLEMEIKSELVIVERSFASPDTPTIKVNHVNGKTNEILDSAIEFSSLEDSWAFIEDMLMKTEDQKGDCSYRQLISLLMRDEKSEFADILKPHAAGKSIPPYLEPHLYLMGIEIKTYHALRKTISQIEDQKKALKVIISSLTQDGNLDLKDVPAELNREKVATKKINEALESLEVDPAYKAIENDLAYIETELKELRAERQALAFKIKQIDSVPLPEEITTDDIAIVYNRVKKGLGDLAEKSLEQAIEFKKKVESFQNRLRNEERKKFKSSYDELSKSIQLLSEQHSSQIQKVSSKEKLQELKIGIAESVQRGENYNERNTLYKQYSKMKNDKEQLRLKRQNSLVELQSLLKRNEKISTSLNDTFVEIHLEVMESAEAALEFKVSTSASAKYPLSIATTVSDGGSHGVDHMSVFIYDCTLLFNEITTLNHPRFLVHDNIFETDRDSCVQALNFLAKQQESGKSFQYIVTLNRDKLEADEKDNLIKLDLNKAKVLTLTKKNQLLGKHYQQKKK